MPSITIKSLNETEVDNSGDNCYEFQIGILEPVEGILSYDSSNSINLISFIVEGTIDSHVILIDCFNSFSGELNNMIEVSGVVAQTGIDFQSLFGGIKYFSTNHNYLTL